MNEIWICIFVIRRSFDRVSIGVISEASREHAESYKMGVDSLTICNVVITTLFLISESSSGFNCVTYECNRS